MRVAAFLLGSTIGVAHGAALIDSGAARKSADLSKAPIVDARSTAERSQFPVPGAIAYERKLQLADEHVLVIADEEHEALAAAQALEQRSTGLTAFALQGGYEALRALRPEARLPALTNRSMPPSFTIPSDTCQTGPALHTYGGEQ